jgi:membrane fusion protein (multidrug efflux system)
MTSSNVPPAVPPAAQAPEAATWRRRHRRLIYGAIILVFLAAGAVLGVWYYLYIQTHESTDDAFIAGHVIQVSTRVPGKVLKVLAADNQIVKEGDLLVQIDPRDYETAVAQAHAALDAAEATRKNAEVNVRLIGTVTGASVAQAKAGVDEAVSGVEMAKAQVAVAKSKQAQALAGLAAAKAKLEQAKAAATAAGAEATKAADDLKRYEELVAANRISKQQIDAARAAATATAAQREAALKGVDAAQAGIASAEADQQVAADSVKLADAQQVQADGKVAEYKAKLDDAQAAPDRVAAARGQLDTATAEVARLKAVRHQAELNLSYTDIKAGEAGRITKKSVEPGAFFQPGQAMLALVPEAMWVVANFKETQLDRIKPGQAVDISIDAWPDKVFRGHVDSLQSGTGSAFSLLPPENATGNYVKVVQRVPVKIVFDEPPGPEYHLAPGMSVVPEVHVK